LSRTAAALLVAVTIAAGGCSSAPKARVFRVPSSSMEPTLHCAQPALGCHGFISDLVAVRPFGKSSPRRLQIVVFSTPPLAKVKCGAGGIFIKRLIGLPGETVADKHGRIFVDGRLLAEPYIPASRRAQDSLFGTWHVPFGQYFLLGDNRGSSCDSRVWGSVPRRNLIGAVFEIKRGSHVIHFR
jgi:signal peptidase I